LPDQRDNFRCSRQNIPFKGFNGPSPDLSAQNIVFKELIGKILKNKDLPTAKRLLEDTRRAFGSIRGDADGIVPLSDSRSKGHSSHTRAIGLWKTRLT
jgi:hypothetical protein